MRGSLYLQPERRELVAAEHLTESLPENVAERNWYAVFTLPQNEKSAAKQLALREVEAFLPTYETTKVWKNRQRVKTQLPLFPTYLFVHINSRQRTRVLESPGVIQIVGNSRERVPVPDAEIELLRAGVRGRNMEPYRELAVGRKVRIKNGSMEGVEGVLVRKGNGLRFVLALEMINQFAAIEVDAEDLEQVEM
jgi:transcription antitermination factor NusG